jgi:hypothetical protein
VPAGVSNLSSSFLTFPTLLSTFQAVISSALMSALNVALFLSADGTVSPTRSARLAGQGMGSARSISAESQPSSQLHAISDFPFELFESGVSMQLGIEIACKDCHK